MRLAAAQVTLREDPGDRGQLRQSGQEVRELMGQASQEGARVIHFPEGATCSPHKRIMSATGPAEVGPADWDRADWPALREEVTATARLAGELRLWTVLGSVHPLTPPHRPHNSLYVISDRGELVTRYDERLLSNTKLSFMYAPGSVPVTFDGRRRALRVRAGHRGALPRGVHRVRAARRRRHPLLHHGSRARPRRDGRLRHRGAGPRRRQQPLGQLRPGRVAQGPAPAGIIAPDGRWAARCPGDGYPALAVADIDNEPESRDIAVSKARPWRRLARTGIYDAHQVADDRSDDRTAF